MVFLNILSSPLVTYQWKFPQGFLYSFNVVNMIFKMEAINMIQFNAENSDPCNYQRDRSDNRSLDCGFFSYLILSAFFFRSVY